MMRRNLASNLKIIALLSLLTGLFVAGGAALAGTAGIVIGLVLAGAMNFTSYWFSDSIVLKIYGAEPMSEEDYPDLHSRVEKLARQAGIPKPKLYRNSMEVPNAFATGRNPQKGVVCLTDGLIESLDDNEIDGVIAHEMAHIKNRDTLVNAVVATLAGGVAILAEMAFWSSLFTRSDSRELISTVAFMITVPIIATLVRLAVSRSMEYRADSDAVRIHGDRQGLVSALEKISSANKSYRPRKHTSKVQEAGSNLFIENPFSSDSLTRFFSTHPPLKDRIENINSTEV